MTVMQIFGLKGIEEFSSNLHYLVNILSRKFNTFPSGLLDIFCFLKKPNCKNFYDRHWLFFRCESDSVFTSKTRSNFEFPAQLSGSSKLWFFFPLLHDDYFIEEGMRSSLREGENSPKLTVSLEKWYVRV